MIMDRRLIAAVLAIVASGALLASQLRSNDRSAPVTQDELEDAVFVCSETKDVFVGKVRPTPATHPGTGRATLQPGLYSAKTKAWIPGPPFETRQRGGTPVQGPGGETLSLKGPIPETAKKLL